MFAFRSPSAALVTSVFSFDAAARVHVVGAPVTQRNRSTSLLRTQPYQTALLARNAQALGAHNLYQAAGLYTDPYILAGLNVSSRIQCKTTSNTKRTVK